MLNALAEKGQKAKKKKKKKKRENHCTFVQTHYYTDPSEFKATVIELVSSQAQTSLPVGLPGKLLFWEGARLITRAGDACQAGLFPQLIFFHNPPCTLNLIILAPGQTATAFRWCIQYQRPWSQGWSIRWKGRVLAKDSAPWSNEASTTLWAWAEWVTLEMHEGQ